MRTECLDKLIRAVCPIDGVSADGVIWFQSSATDAQKAQAQSVYDANKDLPDLVDYQSQINALEQSSLMPRATREFMLLQYAALAAGQGITTAQLLDPNDAHYSPAFSKLQALDLEIKSLRAKL